MRRGVSKRKGMFAVCPVKCRKSCAPGVAMRVHWTADSGELPLNNLHLKQAAEQKLVPLDSLGYLERRR